MVLASVLLHELRESALFMCVLNPFNGRFWLITVMRTWRSDLAAALMNVHLQSMWTLRHRRHVQQGRIMQPFSHAFLILHYGSITGFS